jgi:tetratricopeptide (TPR) repeat protein
MDETSYIYLGMIYEKGIDVEQNFKKAFEYYSEAAEYSITGTAEFLLGNFYFDGNYVEKNYEKAIEFYKISFEKGNIYAAHNMYYLVYTSSTEPKSEKVKNLLQYISILNFNPLIGFRFLNTLITLVYIVYFIINGGWAEKISSLIFCILVIRDNFIRSSDMAILNNRLTKKVRRKLKLTTYAANFLILIKMLIYKGSIYDGIWMFVLSCIIFLVSRQVIKYLKIYRYNSFSGEYPITFKFTSKIRY